jgi:hypothetical protein
MGDSLDQQVEAAVHLALGRPATTEERELLIGLADRRGLDNVCRLIFNLNEFVFVD